MITPDRLRERLQAPVSHQFSIITNLIFLYIIFQTTGLTGLAADPLASQVTHTHTQ
jgi:hypothetical protein